MEDLERRRVRNGSGGGGGRLLQQLYWTYKLRGKGSGLILNEPPPRGKLAKTDRRIGS